MRTLKDLANEMQLHPRTVKRWWKKLGVPPTVQGHGSHRWDETDAGRLLKAWHDYWAMRGHQAAVQGQKFSGLLREDPFQLPLKFHGNNTSRITSTSNMPRSRLRSTVSVVSSTNAVRS